MLDGVIDCVAELLGGLDGDELLGAGLDHQGESVLAWDAVTGSPLTPVVVWQDKRAESVLAEIGPDVPARSGLPLDPYFSAGKLAWLLSTRACARGRPDAGDAASGDRRRVPA